MLDMTKVPEHLVAARKAKGFSVMELAAELGAEPVWIGQVEAGVYELGFRELTEFSDILDVTWDLLAISEDAQVWVGNVRVFSESLGLLLRALMDLRSYSQSMLAAKLGLSQSRVSALLRGQIVRDQHLVEQTLKILGFDLSVTPTRSML